MPFTPVANCSRCEIRWSAGTNQCENTLAYLWSGTAPTAAELTSLATEVGGTVAARMRNMMHNGIVFREVYCRNIHTQNAEQGTYTFPPNTTGNRNGSAVALNEAAGLVKRTGLTGRANRGRNSFSGFIEQDLDGNTIGATILQVLADVAISILAARVGGRFIPAVASASRGLGIRLQSALSLDSHVDSQKTRLNAHGT